MEWLGLTLEIERRAGDEGTSTGSAQVELGRILPFALS
jgi:hypothetical protein